MALREKLQLKLAGAFEKLDNVPVNAVFVSVNDSTYSPETGVTEFVEQFTAQVVLDLVTEADRLVNQGALANGGGLGDYKALAQINKLGFIPKVGDKLTIESESYYIIKSETDPARVLWTGYLNKAGAVNNGLG